MPKSIDLLFQRILNKSFRLVLTGEDNHEHGCHESGRDDEEFPGVFHDRGLSRTGGAVFQSSLFFGLGLSSGFGSLLFFFSLSESSGVNRSFFLLGFENFGSGGVLGRFAATAASAGAASAAG